LDADRTVATHESPEKLISTALLEPASPNDAQMDPKTGFGVSVGGQPKADGRKSQRCVVDSRIRCQKDRMLEVEGKCNHQENVLSAKQRDIQSIEGNDSNETLQALEKLHHHHK
jgi:hypothetical protein